MSITRSLATAIAATVLSVVLAAATAQAAGSDDDRQPSRRVDPNYTAAVDQIRAGDYEAAIPLLESVTRKDPDNADAFNYLGYANRKLQRYPVALEHYQRALALDSRHRGAHEYIGELYLETGDLARAEEHLAALDRICFFGCDEYDELKERVEAYKSGRTSEQSMNAEWAN